MQVWDCHENKRDGSTYRDAATGEILFQIKDLSLIHISENGTTPAGQSYFYAPNDASIGDVDGDGEYEIILKWDPSNAHDNSHDGYTGERCV